MRRPNTRDYRDRAEKLEAKAESLKGTPEGDLAASLARRERKKGPAKSPAQIQVEELGLKFGQRCVVDGVPAMYVGSKVVDGQVVPGFEPLIQAVRFTVGPSGATTATSADGVWFEWD